MKKLLLTFLLIFPLLADAARQTALITGYVAHQKDGKRFVLLKLENSVATECNITGRYAFNDDQENYETIASSVIAAFHAKTPVSVVYTETCNVFSNAYDVQYICVGDIPC